MVIPSGNTGNNTVTTPNTTTPAVSTQETQVIEALKAMGLTEKEAKLYYMINAYSHFQNLLQKLQERMYVIQIHKHLKIR